MAGLITNIGNAFNYLVGGGAESVDPYAERRPGGPKGPKRKPTPLESKHWEWADRKARRENQLENLKAENEQLQATIASWKDAITDTSQKRTTVKQDLDASKLSAPGQEEIKLDIVHQLVDSMNKAISDLAREFREQIQPSKLPSQIITDIGRKSKYNNVKFFITQLQKENPRDIRGDFILGPIVQHIICARLIEDIFDRFWPGSDPVLDKFFSEMREKIEEKDNLDRANRWRALTTSYLDPMPKEYGLEVARRLISDIKNVYNMEQIVAKLTPTPVMEESILSLVETAMEIHRLAKNGCIEGEVKVYLANGGDKFDDILMRPVDSSPRPRFLPSFCLLSVGIGMNTHRVNTEPDGSITFTRLIYKPSDALCMDSVFFV